VKEIDERARGVAVESAAGSGAVLVIGAGSAIARAISARFAAAGHDIILAGRGLDDLRATAADLKIRYNVRTAVLPFEALDFEGHGGFFKSSATQFESGLFGVVVCHGMMPSQAEAQKDWEIARRTIDVNYTSAVSILNLAAEYFQSRKAGFLCVLSSVAGDRGRQSNYLYGSAKGALSLYLQGLRQRLAKAGVRVVTVKPGFTDTAMTWGLPGMFLVASPEKVAEDVFRGVNKGKPTVYTPGFWRVIMFIIRSIPEAVYNRMKL